jgi:hypothetical protein
VSFRPLTRQQAAIYAALRRQGLVLVMTNTARPLAALKARGLVRYRYLEHHGERLRVATLRAAHTPKAPPRNRYIILETPCEPHSSSGPTPKANATTAP